MTNQQALKNAHKRWGKRAAVQASPREGRIGAHGEYLPCHIGNNKEGDPRKGHYLCTRCTTIANDDEGNVIERKVWHPLGGHQTAFKVGFIDGIIGGFHVKGEGGSWADAFERAEGK